MAIDQILSASIANGAVVPADLSTGAPTWDASGNLTPSGQIRGTASATPPTFADSTGTQIGTLCRAWVNFNGTSGSTAARASFNVSSVTRSLTGTYVVTFGSAFADANYSAVVGMNGTSNLGAVLAITFNTGSVTIQTANNTGTVADQTIVTLAVFR